MKFLKIIGVFFCAQLYAQHFSMCVPASPYDVYYISIQYVAPIDGPTYIGKHVHVIHDAQNGGCINIDLEDEELKAIARGHRLYITHIEASKSIDENGAEINRSVKFYVEEDSNSDIATGIQIPLRTPTGIHANQKFLLQVLPYDQTSCKQGELNCVCNTDRDACFKVVPKR